MMKKLVYISLIAFSMIQSSCNNTPSSQASKPDSQTSKNELIADSCKIEVNGVKFAKSINLSNGAVKQDSDSIVLTAGSQTDLFCDPKEVGTNTTAPFLITTVDNTKPFTFTVKVTPEFTEKGTYSAGGIMAFIDENHWQKLCYEQDEEGNHRVVTVRTSIVSDDNNHDKVNLQAVYLRMSSDTKVIGNFYSENGKDWHLVRVYKNEYPDMLDLSIVSQSPKDSVHTCSFTSIDFVPKAVSNFRTGAL